MACCEQVRWNVAPLAHAAIMTSPDITSVVQAIVDSADWTPGSPLTLVISVSVRPQANPRDAILASTYSVTTSLTRFLTRVAL